MDVDVGPIADALDPYHRRYRHGRRETLGDLAGRRDPYARERIRGRDRRRHRRPRRRVEQMAVMTPVLRRSLEDATRRMEDAIARGRSRGPTTAITTGATIRATTTRLRSRLRSARLRSGIRAALGSSSRRKPGPQVAEVSAGLHEVPAFAGMTGLAVDAPSRRGARDWRPCGSSTNSRFAPFRARSG